MSTLNPIDVDGDTLIDINSLERLYNMRYNLDVGATGDDGRYKESTQTADDQGMLCGADAATPCSGYELTRALDFATSSSYDSDMVNDDWCPDNADPNVATNAGWPPIGSCNDDVNMDNIVCDDGNDTPFAARFEGNGYTISNLYARNTNNSTAANIGLFNTIAVAGIIRSIGLQNAALYGSNASVESVGGLAGRCNGIIIASYVQDTTADGGAGILNYVGGLVGNANNTASRIIASYVQNTTANGGANNEYVGGLVGQFTDGTVIASYALGGTANGVRATIMSVAWWGSIPVLLPSPSTPLPLPMATAITIMSAV